MRRTSSAYSSKTSPSSLIWSPTVSIAAAFIPSSSRTVVLPRVLANDSPLPSRDADRYPLWTSSSVLARSAHGPSEAVSATGASGSGSGTLSGSSSVPTMSLTAARSVSASATAPRSSTIVAASRLTISILRALSCLSSHLETSVSIADRYSGSDPAGILGHLSFSLVFTQRIAVLRAKASILPPLFVGRMSHTVRLQLPQSVESPGNSFLYTVLLLPVSVSARLIPVLLYTLASSARRAIAKAAS